MIIGAGLFRPVPPPAIQSVVVTEAPVHGGTVARLVGEGFGNSESDIAGVSVAGHELTLGVGYNRSSSLELSVRLPPGVLAFEPVVVRTTGGLVATGAVPYDAPTVDWVQPSSLQLGAGVGGNESESRQDV